MRWIGEFHGALPSGGSRVAPQAGHFRIQTSLGTVSPAENERSTRIGTDNLGGWVPGILVQNGMKMVKLSENANKRASIYVNNMVKEMKAWL